jgi:DNA gyrase subunit B
MAFVTRAVSISLEDRREDKETTFYFEGGISSFVKYLNRNRDSLHDVVYVEKEVDEIGVEVAIQYRMRIQNPSMPLPTRSIQLMVAPT